MFKDVPLFVPSQVCLSCQGCCRFHDSKSIWRPKITSEETALALQEGGKKAFVPSAVDSEGFLSTIPHEGLHICYFFQPLHKACGIYPVRPFECRLYPFLLQKGKDRIDVIVHRLCPYVQQMWDTKEFEAYRRQLEKFFRRKDVLDFLKRHAQMIGDYSSFSQEWDAVFSLRLSL